MVISKVLADAGRGTQEAAFEWVEIFNPTWAAVDLEGWSLADNRGEDLLPAIVLASGARVVVGGSEALRDEFGEGVGLAWVGDGRIGNGLANSGDRVLLLDPAGQAMDGVSWGSDRTITILAVPPRGQTLSRGTDDVWTAGAPSPGGRGGGRVWGADGVADREDLRERGGRVARYGVRVGGDPQCGRGGGRSERLAAERQRIDGRAAVDAVAAAGTGETAGAGGNERGGTDGGAGIRVLVEDGRLGNGLANGGDVVTLRDPAGRVVDEVDYRTPPLPRPEAGRSIALTEGALTDAGWVLNTEPSPGTAAVTRCWPDWQRGNSRARTIRW